MIRLRRKTAPQPTFEAPTSTLLCQAHDCTNHNAVRCAYRDRRGRVCQGQFCPRHNASVDGLTYCRRHAGTMRALGGAGQERFGLPDIDNRGPSLVNWIASDLDTSVRNLLTHAARDGEQVLFDREVSLAFDTDRRARWERSWKLVDSTGVVLKVTVHVEEESDPLVTVSVGQEMAASGVPPWIERRLRGERVPQLTDQAERKLFYRFLEENITAAVAALRADHPAWA
jgi:hypothetical protein